MKNIEAYIATLAYLTDTDIKVMVDEDTMFGVVAAWSFKHATTVIIQVFEGMALVKRFVDGQLLDAVEGMFPTELFDDMFVLTSKEIGEISDMAFVGFCNNDSDDETQWRIDSKVVTFGPIEGDLELKFDTNDYFVV